MSGLNSNAPAEKPMSPLTSKPEPHQEGESFHKQNHDQSSLEKQKGGSETTEVVVPPKLLIDSENILSRRKNIFAGDSSGSSINIFSKGNSVNLFNLQKEEKISNIFANASVSAPIVPAESDDQEEEGNSGSRLSVSEDKEATQKEKGEMKFDYGPTPEHLGEFKLNLFRAGASKALENVIVCPEKPPKSGQKVGNNILWIIVRTMGARLCLYQAMLLGECKCESFMGREDNLKLPVFKKEGKEDKPAREMIKVQFTEKEDAEVLKKTICDFFSQSQEKIT